MMPHLVKESVLLEALFDMRISFAPNDGPYKSDVLTASGLRSTLLTPTLTGLYSACPEPLLLVNE